MQTSRSNILEDICLYLKQQTLFGEELVLRQPDILISTQQSVCAESLDDYQNSICDCQKCTLSQTRTNFVFGRGNPNANLMLIGEAPGRDEDLQGKPFVGKAGQLLDKILNAIDFTPDEVFIANILKCRPPNNRDPNPIEVDACMPYLMTQIKMIQPKIILALGRIAAQNLLKTSTTLGRLREAVHDFQGIPLFVTFHPAALLRNPHWKRPVWEDIQKLRHYYDDTVGDKSKWSPKKK